MPKITITLEFDKWNLEPTFMKIVEEDNLGKVNYNYCGITGSTETVLKHAIKEIQQMIRENTGLDTKTNCK